MGNIFDAAFWTSIIGIVGVPAVFALLVFLLRQSDERRMDKETEARDKNALEHQKKWDSMIEQHKEVRAQSREEFERLMKLYDRMASATELQANLSARMNENITTNQFCPKARIKENPS